jgi:hypothetical protein
LALWAPVCALSMCGPGSAKCVRAEWVAGPSDTTSRLKSFCFDRPPTGSSGLVSGVGAHRGGWSFVFGEVCCVLAMRRLAPCCVPNLRQVRCLIR